MRFSRSIIFVFIGIAIIGSLFLFWLYEGYDQRRSEIVSREQNDAQNQYSSTINSYRLLSQSLYDEVINSERVVNIINQADQSSSSKQAVLRDELYRQFLPVFNRLQNKNFKQLHFHLAGGVSFLRMQAPDKFGDQLMSIRPSLAEINRSGKYLEGFEEDKYFSGFHYLFPLFDQQKLVGSVETSVSFSTFSQQMSSIFPMTYQFLIKKNVIDDQVFADVSRFYYISELNRNYFYEKEQGEQNRVDNVLPEELTKINNALKNKISAKMAAGQIFTESLAIDKINYLVSFIPVKNIGGKQVVYLVSYHKDDTLYTLKADLIDRYIYTISVLLIILAFVYFISENQQKLLDAGERIQNITAAMGEGLMVIDNAGLITFFNKSASDLTGFSAKEVINKPYLHKIRFVGENDDKANDKFIKQVLDKKQLITTTRDLYLWRRHGDKFPIAASASPLKTKDGRVIGCIIVFRDITEEKAIDKTKTEFVSLASHQLKTPLSAVNWYTEMLMDQDVGPINDRQKSFLKEILDGNQRMVKLVNSLLNVSRIDMGTLSIVPEPVDLIAMTESMITELQFGIKSKNLKLIKRFDKGFPKINLDASLMRIVIQNLLSNAVKYTREGGLIEVEIKKQDAKTAFMLVKDNGYGIPKNQQSSIFKKLFRADNVKSTKVEGTGLGLYVAKAVIEAFDGRIWFESEENLGSKFFITLPLAGVTKKEGTRGLEANT